MIDRMRGIDRQNEAHAPEFSESPSGSPPHSAGHRRKKQPQGSGASTTIWILSFTDIMALMLTFFVLLYAMSDTEKNSWEEMTDSLRQKLSRFEGARFHAGEEEALDIEKIDYNRALNLHYLAALMTRLLAEDENLARVRIIPQAGRLVLALPDDLLFAAGQAQISDSGERALFALGGRLSRIRNRIEIIGHTDPRPLSADGAGFSSNWELSLARAAQVSGVLTSVGYGRPITIRGLSSSTYEDLPSDIPPETRLNIARRVDITILPDDGTRLKFYDSGMP